MGITRNNYESWFIDYFDGTLDAAQSAQLFLFLEQHPDLGQEFDTFSGQPLDAPTETFTSKSSLRRDEVNADNVDRYLVAALEGDLSVSEAKQLDHFLQVHPEYKRNEKLISLTKLPVDAESFPGKKELKQPIPLFATGNSYLKYAVAAVIMLLLLSGGFLLVTRLNDQRQIQTADQEVPAGQNQESSPSGKPLLEQKQDASQNETNLAQQTKSSDTVIRKNPAPLQKEKHGITTEHGEQIVQTEPAKDTIKNVPEEKVSDEVPFPKTVVEPTEQPVAAVTTAPSAQPTPALTVWDAVKQKAGKEIEKATGTTEQRQLAAIEGSPKPKFRLMGLVGKGIEKVSGDKVKLTTSYDVDGEVMAYNFSVGGVAVQKK